MSFYVSCPAAVDIHLLIQHSFKYIKCDTLQSYHYRTSGNTVDEIDYQSHMYPNATSEEQPMQLFILSTVESILIKKHMASGAIHTLRY